MQQNGYPPRERARRSDRYAQGQPPMQQGWQQGYPPQQPVRQRTQSYPQQTWQQPYQQTQQPYGHGYYPPKQEAPRPRYPQEPMPAYRGYEPPQPPKQGFNWKLAGIILAVIAVLVVGSIVGYKAYQRSLVEQYVASFNNVYCQNVYVDGIHLGGMTQQQALAAVTDKAQQRNEAWSVKLTYQGQLVTELNASQLGMTVDVVEQLQNAWAQGHTGTTDQRLAAMDALAQEPYHAYSALPSGDTSVVDSVLAQIRDKVYRVPQDAKILQFDPQNSVAPFSFQQEVPGMVLDTDPIKERIYQMVSTLESGTIEITPTPIQPQVTVADLQKQVTLRACASTIISYRSTENRTNNIKRAFQLISGTILQPGETFSFNDKVGERSVKNGFYEAIEYAYGEQTMGIGGGVCQASSTIYQAAVAAGMDITKREQHSLAVNYTDFGLDATVYWSRNRKIDLAFKNTSGAPIYITAAVQMDPNNRKQWIAKVCIYGTDMGDVTYKLEAVTQEIEAPTEVKYVTDKKHEYVTYVDEEHVVSKAEKGYIVDSYRVKYVNDVEVERTHMYTDNYAPKPKTVYVGTEEREVW